MIYFVRHGETDYNKEGRAQGHADIPLNAKGIEQAEETAEKLKSVAIDVIYSSPLKRARKTADTINKYHGVEVIEDDRLKELNVGNRQGVVLKDCPEELLADFFQNPKKYGAESYEELCARVESIYKELEKEKRNILIVSHGGVYRAITRYIKNLDSVHSDKIQSLKNCQVVNFTEMQQSRDLG